MPWDHCELWVATLEGGSVVDRLQVAGRGDEAVTQPLWGPDGNLYFASDRYGWWNIYCWTGSGVERVTEISGDQAVAHWEHGYKTFDFLDDGRLVVITQHGAFQFLDIVTAGKCRRVPLEFSSLKPYLAVRGSEVGVIAASATSAAQPMGLTVDALSVVPLSSSTVTYRRPPEDIVSESTTIGDVRALLYRSVGDRSGVLPTIVRAHPGPTYNMRPRIDSHIRYFTRRGFLIVDVDYRGSTGYGRAFRQSLYGHWGEYDVADCVEVGRWLVATGQCDPALLFIAGASAGGYTALRAVCSDSTPFAAAVARSAIVDPSRWVATVPPFQRSHAQALAVNAPAVSAAAIARPVLLLHGSRDKVAPIQNIIALADTLNLMCRTNVLMSFDAGHSLNTPTVLTAVLEAEARFYGRVDGWSSHEAPDSDSRECR